MPRETRNVTPSPPGLGDRATGSLRQKMGFSAKRASIGPLVTAGKPFGLKDTKGFAYLAHLLRHPGTEFHVLDLVGGIAAGGEETKPKSADCRGGDDELAKGRDPYHWPRRRRRDAGRASQGRPIAAVFLNCGRNWKKPRSSETRNAQKKLRQRSMR